MKNLFVLAVIAVVVTFLGTARSAEAGHRSCESGYSTRGYGVPAYGGYNQPSYDSYYRSRPYSSGFHYWSPSFSIDSRRLGLGVGRSHYDHYRYDHYQYGHHGWYR